MANLGRKSLIGNSAQRNLERGQASLEMILLMIIGMIVILGLVYRFNTAFKRYTIEMYGTYYRCLLETGELPGTGSVCRDREARYDIANGRALVTDGDTGTGGTDDGSGGSGGSGSGGSGGSGSGGSGSGGSGGSGSGKNGRSGSGNQAGSGSGGSGGGSGSGGGGDAGSEAVGGNSRNGGRGSVVSRLKNAGRNRSTSVGSASDLSKEDADAAAAANGDNGLIVDATSARHTNNPLRSAKTKMNFSMEGDQYQREETKAVAPIAATATKKSADRGGDSLRPRKAVEKGDRAPAKKRNDDDGGGLEFGKLFKLFLIIGIVIAIVVFLGGQVLQISKSGEK